MKLLSRHLFSFPLLVPLLVCGTNSSSLKWTEDVLLPDGRVVTLTRYQEFKGNHELGDTPNESDSWMQFKNPDNGESVRWENDHGLIPLALMLDQKKTILLTKPHDMYRYK